MSEVETYTLHSRHGLSRTKEYRAWTSAKTRCSNPNYKLFHNYGGRGILMCNGWRNNFTAFYKDLGDKPSPKHSLDRIDNDGNYSCGRCKQCLENGWPMNCKWSTKREQAYNRRVRKNATGHTGIGFSGERFKAYFLHRNLGTFDTIEEAVAAREIAIKSDEGRQKLRELIMEYCGDVFKKHVLEDFIDAIMVVGLSNTPKSEEK